MDVVQHPADIQQSICDRRRSGQTIGLVPTMGALHQGHLSLVAAARAACDCVVTTIFVNPKQFAAGEDFEDYPRTMESDLDLCRAADTDLVFAPAAGDMYLPDCLTKVEVADMAKLLEGESRPNHFNGVTTIVAKLFNITLPDRAYFGQKDYQQQMIIRRMVRDLNWNIDIVTCPTIREPDGLAMSSRNRYLSPVERDQALILNRVLEQADRLASAGGMNPQAIQTGMTKTLSNAEGLEPDYAVVVDPESLRPMEKESGNAVALLAVRVGNTRLIDNRMLTFAE
ncbi:MAG: pantoate--beta-alanine ligase [Fuerstiella sp.]|nr:pantoate--beta-alanine ligase [Fuerstiella sp.]